MSVRSDPKHVQTVANILALALEPESAEGDAALRIIRQRALHDGTTGGLLKKLLCDLAGPAPSPPAASDRPPAEGGMLQRRLNDIQFALDRERRQGQWLRERLAQLEHQHLPETEPGSVGPVRLERTNAILRARVGALEQRLRAARDIKMALVAAETDLAQTIAHRDRLDRWQRHRRSASRIRNRLSLVAMVFVALVSDASGDAIIAHFPAQNQSSSVMDNRGSEFQLLEL